MSSVEKRGRTVEEAVALALEELGVGRDDVDVEVLEEPLKGFLGLIGSRGARVRVTVRPKKADLVGKLLRDIGAAIGDGVEVKVVEDEEYIFAEMNGGNSGALIGRRGQALDSLQYLVNLAAGKGSRDKKRVILDIEGYRRRREDVLRRLALRMAERVKRTGQPVSLEPMSAQERRVVHTALQGDPSVTTHSEGEEPFRKIVISARE